MSLPTVSNSSSSTTISSNISTEKHQHSESTVVLHHHLWHYVYHHHIPYQTSRPTMITVGHQYPAASLSTTLPVATLNQAKYCVDQNDLRPKSSSSLISMSTKNEPNLASNASMMIRHSPQNNHQSFSSSSSISSSTCSSTSVSGSPTPYLGSSSWSSSQTRSDGISTPAGSPSLESSLETLAANYNSLALLNHHHHHLDNGDGSFNSTTIPTVVCYPNIDATIVSDVSPLPPIAIAPILSPETTTHHQIPMTSCIPKVQTPMPTIPLKHFYAQLGVFYHLVPWNQSFGMERVWMSEFRRIFSNFYTELWSIQPVDKKPSTNSPIRLHMFVDSAKVRFCCERCNHSWTSMKGRVVFWFNLLQPNFNVGIVAIKLFGQKCDACNVDNSFEQPMWYPEEVTKVLMNLYNRVGQIFYGFEKTKYERQRRMGRPRTQHNKFLCQACIEGICLNRSAPASYSSVDASQAGMTYNVGKLKTSNHKEFDDCRCPSVTGEQQQQVKEEQDSQQVYDSEDSGVVECGFILNENDDKYAVQNKLAR